MIVYWYSKIDCSHRLAAKYGMIPVYKENFANLYEQKVKDSRHSNLLRRMGALEVSETWNSVSEISENSKINEISENSELVKLMKVLKKKNSEVVKIVK